MPTTTNGIFYADTSTPMSVADITSTMATSIDVQIAKLGATGIVTSATERDALYPVPIQGNKVFRTDLGIYQTYFLPWNATTNVGGKGTVAAWVNENRVFIQATEPNASTYVTPRANDMWFY